MKAPFYVETLARNGEVLHRHAVPVLPFSIGRAYDNDHIIDDEYCAPHHAVVEETERGVLVVRDLGTLNGIIHKGKRHTELALDGDTVIRMGHTSLRVRAADCAVPAEQLDRTRHGWEGVIPGGAGLVLVLLAWFWIRWINDTSGFQGLRYLQEAISVLGIALAWGGVWTLVNTMIARHTRLGRHLFIFGCSLAAVGVWWAVSSVLGYAFSLDALVRYGNPVIVAVACTALYFHLKTVKPAYARRFRIGTAGLFVLGCGLVLVSNYLRTGRLADEPYMAVLLPPSMRASPDHSVDDFMRQAAALKPRVDRDRTRKVRDSEDEDED
jgi:hypothetical protein